MTIRLNEIVNKCLKESLSKSERYLIDIANINVIIAGFSFFVLQGSPIGDKPFYVTEKEHSYILSEIWWYLFLFYHFISILIFWFSNLVVVYRILLNENDCKYPLSLYVGRIFVLIILSSGQAIALRGFLFSLGYLN